MVEQQDTWDSNKKVLLVALEKSLGVVATACKAAGIARSSYYRWMQEDAAFKAAVEELTEVSLDFGESQLHKLMNGYHLPDVKVFFNKEDPDNPIVLPIQKHFGPDAAAVIFFLKTKGKKRGYVLSKAIDVTSGGQRVTGIAIVDYTDDSNA